MCLAVRDGYFLCLAGETRFHRERIRAVLAVDSSLWRPPLETRVGERRGESAS